jgi:hypothetical protein
VRARSFNYRLVRIAFDECGCCFQTRRVFQKRLAAFDNLRDSINAILPLPDGWVRTAVRALRRIDANAWARAALDLPGTWPPGA